MNHRDICKGIATNFISEIQLKMLHYEMIMQSLDPINLDAGYMNLCLTFRTNLMTSGLTTFLQDNCLFEIFITF